MGSEVGITSKNAILVLVEHWSGKTDAYRPAPNGEEWWGSKCMEKIMIYDGDAANDSCCWSSLTI